MRGTRFVLAVGAVVAAFALVGCGGDDDEAAATDTETTATETTVEPGSTLIGTVGPGFTITLTTEGGEDVTALPAGHYTIQVDDQSDIHDFHLTGPGVDETTEVGEVEMETFEVDLQSGTYSYVCDPHSSSMNGSFEVTG